MRVSAIMRAVLEEVSKCPNETFEEWGGQIIGPARNNGWIVKHKNTPLGEPLIYTAW